MDIQFDINISDKCQYNCYNCIKSDYTPPNISIFKNKINSIKEKVNVRFWITGGEPFDNRKILDSFLDLNIESRIPTVGINFIPEYFEKYNNIKLFVIAIKGTPEYEAHFRKNGNADKYSRKYLFNIKDKYRNNLIITHVIHKQDFENEQYEKNLKYIGGMFPNIVKAISLDRYDETIDEKHIIKIGQLAKKYNFVITKRILFPTIFVNGNDLIVTKTIYVKETNTIYKLDKQNDFEKALIHCNTLHNSNKIDVVNQCNVWKLYQCGGPNCRYDAAENCRNYWTNQLKLERAKNGQI